MTERALSLIRQSKMSDILGFFARLGWMPTEHPNERIYFMQRTSDDLPDVEFVIPRSDKAADFERRISEAVDTISEIRGEDADEVVTTIRFFSTDIIRKRFVSEQSSSNSLPLSTAQELIKSVKDMFVYAAAGEISRLPYIARATDKAKDHARQCRFGHTFEGSFGFTIESPLLIFESAMPGIQVPPFERRVVERVLRGMEDLKESARMEDIKPLVRGYEEGFNANMCDALAAMKRQVPDLRLDCSFLWSPRITRQTAEPTRVDIAPIEFSYLEYAARELRKVEAPREITIVGRIVTMTSKLPPWDDEPNQERTVQIVWRDEKRTTNTKVRLEPAEYIEALHAHEKGYWVAIEGMLERRGRQSRLSNPTKFNWQIQGNLFDEGDLTMTEE